MNIKILVPVVAGLITLGIVGTNLAGNTEKSDCPASYQSFQVDAFTEAEATALWPTGAEAYASQEDAVVDYPDRSLEAFVWSNIVVKDGFTAHLKSKDRNGDGFVCVKSSLAGRRLAKLYPDYSPLYLFSISDPGQ